MRPGQWAPTRTFDAELTSAGRYGLFFDFMILLQTVEVVLSTHDAGGLTQKDIALAEGIDPEIAFELVRVESRFNPRAVSPVGARGLTQVMPRTARWLLPSLLPGNGSSIST